MRALFALALVACATDVPLPESRSSGPVDIAAYEHCVEWKSARGIRGVTCVASDTSCIAVARDLRAFGRLWVIPESLRLEWLEHCGSSGLRLPDLKTERLNISVQHTVFP